MELSQGPLYEWGVAICKGVFAEGRKFPTERALSVEYGMSRNASS